MKKIGIAVLALALTACATGPTRHNYRNLGWAKTGAQQASVECDAAQQINILLSHDTCMEAKGWKEMR